MCLCEQLYTNFIPKVTPSGLALNVADAVTAVAGDGSRDHETNPYELSLSQLRDMIYALEDFQLSRWRLLKVCACVRACAAPVIMRFNDIVCVCVSCRSMA